MDNMYNWHNKYDNRIYNVESLSKNGQHCISRNIFICIWTVWSMVNDIVNRIFRRC